MLQIAIENPSIEEYFKTQENIKSFLEIATNLDLLSVISEIREDKLHQKTLKRIKTGNVKFYKDGKEMIKALNA